MFEQFKALVDFLSDPRIFFFGTCAGLAAMLIWRRQFSRIWFGVLMLVGSVAFTVVSLRDSDFHAIMTKPDNVPIAGMLFLVGFFTWLALRCAVANDDRRDQGLPIQAELESKQKVFVWPELVYIELIALVLVWVLLIVWSIYLKAPLEEPASPTRSPNPAKAPWYFLGLQEMLVYFDPWLAGVVFPVLIIVGLMAIPYIDRNPKGNGYYTFKERPFAISTFLFGFLILWVALVVLGTFLRGPNWAFFGPFEYWDIGKLEPLINVNLSELFWVRWLGTALPDAWYIREAPGILLVLLYLAVLPWVMARTFFKKIFLEVGMARYMVMAQLLLLMMALPIKMLLRWLFNLKYIVNITEFFLNI